MYDLIIKNGTVVDGTGAPSYVRDIAISGGKIAQISEKLEGGRLIDAKGLIVSPGFIDSHSHADDAMLKYPDMIEKIEQGITTSVAGQCGISIAPVRAEHTYGPADETYTYKTFGAMTEAVKNIPMGANIMTFVGHGTIRKAVMGYEDRKPNAAELAEMKALLCDAMENGAVGLSYGLIYTPGCYADINELTELAGIVKEYGGVISAHIRSESFALEEAVEEFLKIVKAVNVKAVLSHHKAMYKNNWGKVRQTLKMVDEAVNDGYDVYCDVYPYTASNTTLVSTIIPAGLRAYDNDGIVKMLDDTAIREKIKEEYINIYGPDLRYIRISYAAGHHEYENMGLDEIAKQRGDDPFDTAFDIIQACKAEVYVSKFVMCEEDVETVIGYKRAMICTDSSVAKDTSVYHPRLRGTFPRAFGRYVRGRHIVSLEEMVRKCTSMPASVYGLSTKGVLKVGNDADICIFDTERFIDRADYSDCSRSCEGLRYVILGGETVVSDAVYNGVRKGGFIQRK